MERLYMRYVSKLNVGTQQDIDQVLISTHLSLQTCMFISSLPYLAFEDEAMITT